MQQFSALIQNLGDRCEEVVRNSGFWALLIQKLIALTAYRLVPKGLPNKKVFKYLLWYGRLARQHLESRQASALGKQASLSTWKAGKPQHLESRRGRPPHKMENYFLEVPNSSLAPSNKS
ncbi:hypothetical protein WA1_44770 [Scytonema hofmannii PCC 7110]|uniref:Uncharacterized protein n=1 Tax=Scytonema hofmannii PCC 7110 TaxID=128403 RepID=A0A139WWH0_9CYAN|nr:hypothetical protein [Scytonema hofmannii]KYC36789.1 hypothetical protein WA1_44770 [Scytonema hofmannii PCC 7110]